MSRGVRHHQIRRLSYTAVRMKVVNICSTAPRSNQNVTWPTVAVLQSLCTSIQRQSSATSAGSHQRWGTESTLRFVIRKQQVERESRERSRAHCGCESAELADQPSPGGIMPGIWEAKRHGSANPRSYLACHHSFIDANWHHHQRGFNNVLENLHDTINITATADTARSKRFSQIPRRQ